MTDAAPAQTPAPTERPQRPWRRAAVAVVVAAAAFGLFYYVVPRAVGLESTLKQLRAGDIWWLLFACLLEAGSIFGQAVLLRGVFSTPARPISRRNSAEITLAGAAATKLVAAAGAGGIAVSVWALRALGLPAGEVGAGMVCYEIITYGVYLAALVISGLGIWTGLFAGSSPVGVTLIPAMLAAAVIALVLSTLLVEEPTNRWLLKRADQSKGRRARWWRRAAALPRSLHAGLVSALDMLKRRDASTLGAVANWGFDIGVLWASFHAFGHSPPGAVLVMGYFVGTLGNALPLPGGVGGVEGGMIGAFLAFGVSGDLAVLAVIGYRTISYWLPAVPGAIAYARLRHTLEQAHPRAESGGAAQDA